MLTSSSLRSRSFPHNRVPGSSRLPQPVVSRPHRSCQHRHCVAMLGTATTRCPSPARDCRHRQDPRHSFGARSNIRVGCYAGGNCDAAAGQGGPHSAAEVVCRQVENHTGGNVAGFACRQRQGGGREWRMAARKRRTARCRWIWASIFAGAFWRTEARHSLQLRDL